MKAEPYLFFEGRCDEALAFYREALGAEVTYLIRYRDSPEPPKPGLLPPEAGEKVMHCNFRIGQTMLMASDGMCSGTPGFKGFAISLTAADDAAAEQAFSALAEGGQVQMPLAKTFYASRFGMVTDRFGVLWMVLAGA